MQYQHRRFYVSVFFIFLLFLSPLSSQSPPCDDCDGSGTLTGPFTLTVSVDATEADGCDVVITYYKRTCKGFSNLFITQYSSSGSTCSGITDYAQMERALASMLYGNVISMPPYETTDPPAYWRVLRPACWQKSSGMIDSSSVQVLTKRQQAIAISFQWENTLLL